MHELSKYRGNYIESLTARVLSYDHKNRLSEFDYPMYIQSWRSEVLPNLILYFEQILGVLQ